MQCPQCECALSKVKECVRYTKPYMYALRCLDCGLDYTAFQCIKCGTLSARKVCRGCVEMREARMKKSREERMKCPSRS